jgi:hypothetical protein
MGAARAQDGQDPRFAAPRAGVASRHVQKHLDKEDDMPRHGTRSTLAVATLIAALGAPAGASAMPDVAPLTARHPAPPAAQAPVAQTASDGGLGFRWGDAGIGAGAVLLLGAGATAAATGRRRRTELG